MDLVADSLDKIHKRSLFLSFLNDSVSHFFDGCEELKNSLLIPVQSVLVEDNFLIEARLAGQNILKFFRKLSKKSLIFFPRTRIPSN